MKTKLLERRVECLKYHSRGFAASKWAEEVAEKHGTSAQTVLRDWSRRDVWMPEIFQLSNVEKITHEIYNSLEQTKAAAWEIFHMAGSQPAAQVGALKQITDVSAKEIEILQSLDKMPKAVDKINMVNTVKIEMSGLGKRPTAPQT